jgi:AraC family transcriptional regulator of adaptative response / DNA-3-methyladenine glycosylase II
MASASTLPRTPHDTNLPALQVCEQARLSRDPRFDGLFFTAVKSTGIYCRPVCPAPTPRRENIAYYGNAAAAEAAGFRPCLRCRPELSPADGAWRRGDAAVARALKLIDEGALAGQPLAALAERVNLGERQLRRLFVERLGAPPIGVHGTRRLLFAKQLLTETALPITEVALAAGFGSLRRFNTTFRDAYRMAPRDLRKRPLLPAGETLTLRLGYRPPYDFASMLAFLRGRALPGVEVVDAASYARVIGPMPTTAGDAPGWLRVSAWSGGEHALKLELHGAPPTRLVGIVNRLRRMFDLDADPQAIAAVLSRSPRLKPLLKRYPGARVPSGWDGFEIAMRAVVGQQVSVAAARSMWAKVEAAFGSPPDLEAILNASDEELRAAGMSRQKSGYMRSLAGLVTSGELDLYALPEDDEEAIAHLTRIKGIGRWSAEIYLLFAEGRADVFPAGDLAVVNELGRLMGRKRKLSEKRLRQIAKKWRPYRGAAAVLAWHSYNSNVL